jgi:F-box-like
VTIDILPEEVLLEVFDFYVDPTRRHGGVEAWCTLVHVCRKWRNIVLESPLRLNLRIRCHPATPVREKLDTWPTSLIVVDRYNHYRHWQLKLGVANVAAALEQNNRIRQIDLCGVPTLEMEEILAALMHKSFPVLTELRLHSEDETASVDPDSFLGGSIPCLQILFLAHIPFPGLPNLLFSATHLTNLQLFNLSNSGYISPEAMVSCFFALTRLEMLILEFESPESFPIREHRPPPPSTRTLLPALTQLQFGGVSDYLEDFVVRIDTPLLDNLTIHIFHQFIPDTPQLAHFTNRKPKLKAHNEAHVDFIGAEFRLKLGRGLKRG